MNEVLTQATKKIAAIIQKTMVRGQVQQSRVGVPMQELESLIRQSDLEWGVDRISFFLLNQHLIIQLCSN